MAMWKRWTAVATSAFLLAGVLGTVLAAPALGVTTSTQGTLYPWTASSVSTSLPADGVSAYTITFGQPTSTDVTAMTISVTGGTFISGSGVDFGAVTYPTQSIILTSGTNVTWDAATDTESLSIASTVPGTAIFTVQYVSTSLGSKTDSLYAFTFVGTTTSTVSTVYSWTAADPTSAPAVAGTPSALTTTVRDTNNNEIVSGATVSWSLSGPAVFQGTTSQVLADIPVSGTGTASATIVSTGVPGAVTVATTISYLSVNYTLSDITVTFTGSSASVPTQRSQCFKGGWASLVDSRGNAFKNQGDCVSFVSTKGRNLG